MLIWLKDGEEALKLQWRETLQSIRCAISVHSSDCYAISGLMLWMNRRQLILLDLTNASAIFGSNRPTDPIVFVWPATASSVHTRLTIYLDVTAYRNLKLATLVKNYNKKRHWNRDEWVLVISIMTGGDVSADEQLNKSFWCELF